MKTITVCAGLIGALGLGAGTGAASAQESSLGRLFYTPEERQKLDLKRGVAIAPASSTPQTVIVNGMVARTGRAPILFIDGKETTGTGGGASQQQQLHQGIPLKTESGRTIAAKPGQIVDLALCQVGFTQHRVVFRHLDVPLQAGQRLVVVVHSLEDLPKDILS